MMCDEQQLILYKQRISFSNKHFASKLSFVKIIGCLYNPFVK